MKKIILCLIVSFFAFLGEVHAQMSDDQVVNYVKQEYEKGTSQEQIASNLMKKGVSKPQLERIKKLQEEKQMRLSKKKNEKLNEADFRVRTFEAEDKEREEHQNFTKLIDSTFIRKKDSTAIEIFGRNIFNLKNLTFNPDVNIPTPANYRLGPGDEVIIDIWGASQSSVRQTISPEGSITVERLGPIYLNGMSIKEASDYVQHRFSDIYAGINSDGVSQIKLTLGQIRTIQINVIGDAMTPGTYSLSSLSSVFHALYRAGGVNDIGSLRSVKLFRNGKLLRTMDVYKYLLEGKLNDDIRLSDGDVVRVDPYISLVQIEGGIKRPMYYEMKQTETLKDLLDYAGGFTGDAYNQKVKVTRKSGGENKIYTVNETDFGRFILKDKDVVTIGKGLERYDNRVEIKGAVLRPGFFEIGKNISTVKELIMSAEGLKGDAFLNRAVLTREKEDYTTEIISINLRSLLYENGDDVVLRKNDILYILSTTDLKELGDLVVHGEVTRPGIYPYSENITLEDLVVQAGGLLESASTVRVDVSRRIIDPKSLVVSQTLSETFSFSLKDGLIVDGTKGFVLKPYDQIYVRKSPGYRTQQNVQLEGEVLFTGMYALNKKAERISDIIKRAGGITPDAYPQGARLLRKRTKEELFKAQTALKLASKGGKDSISVKQLDIEESYSVGIELDKAIKNPRSDFDLVLREGDQLIIPEYDNTVKINGSVMYPNTVTYKKGEKLSYYVNQAGGYSDNAKKNKSFVIYMNGTVSKIKNSDREAIRPGSEIIVPSKELARKLSVSEILSLGTSVTSMASLISVLINTMK